MSADTAASRPGVSIVISSYNYERFVGETIASALAQTWCPVEVIVVDDGSTDGSRGVIESFGDRITAVFQPNAGHLNACLRGYAAAQHDIIVFLDSDDVLLPEAAATIAAHWVPGLVKLQFQMETIDADGRSEGHVWPKYPPQMTSADLRGELLRTGAYPAPPTSGNAFSRSLLEASRPHGGHRFLDSLLYTIAPLYGEVRTLHQPLVRYRVHGNNTWAQTAPSAERFAFYAESERQRVAILATHCGRLGMPFDGVQVLEKALNYREIELARLKLGAGGLGRAPALLAEAWRAIRAALAHPQGPWHKLLRAAWSIGVTVAPTPLARRLIAMRFVPTARPRLAERLINCLSRRRAAAQERYDSTAKPVRTYLATLGTVAVWTSKT